MLGKMEGKRRRGQQRLRPLNGITDSMDMNLDKLREIVRVCCAAVHEVPKESDMTKRMNKNNRLKCRSPWRRCSSTHKSSQVCSGHSWSAVTGQAKSLSPDPRWGQAERVRLSKKLWAGDELSTGHVSIRREDGALGVEEAFRVLVSLGRWLPGRSCRLPRVHELWAHGWGSTHRLPSHPLHWPNPLQLEATGERLPPTLPLQGPLLKTCLTWCSLWRRND